MELSRDQVMTSFTNILLQLLTLYFQGVSSYLLYIFIANLLVYTSYYISMKFYNGEKILLSTYCYIVVAVLCWIPGQILMLLLPIINHLNAGLYFFSNPPNNFDGTAAQSRNYNKECNIFSFYDYHDIWHFLSAGGMFFCFLLLLTLDEGLQDTETQSILIF